MLTLSVDPGYCVDTTMPVQATYTTVGATVVWFELDGSVVGGKGDLPLSGLSLIHISQPTRPYSTSYAVFCLKNKNTPPRAHADEVQHLFQYSRLTRTLTQHTSSVSH